MKPLTPELRTILEYEVHSSWWAPFVSGPRLQALAASYFAWKTTRKYARWQKWRPR